MGSCCSASEGPVEATPLVTDIANQHNSMAIQQDKLDEPVLEKYNVEPMIVGGSSVGAKRTITSHQQEGPPEKAPTVCEDHDESDGVPLHLPVDTAAAAVSDPNMDGIFMPDIRPISIGGLSKPQKCPYCDRENGNIFFYLTMMECSHQLLDKLYWAGWWRTGTICFKPDITQICCPNYSIRLEVSRYVISKSQRSTAKRFKSFLCNGDPRWKPVAAMASSSPDPQANSNGDHSEKRRKQKGPVKPGVGADPSKPRSRKAKDIRKERWIEKQKLHGEAASTPKQQTKPTAKTVEEVLAEVDAIVTGQKHTFRQEMLPCNPPSPRLVSLLTREYDLYCKFQESIHYGKSKFQSYDEYIWGFVNSLVKNNERTSERGEKIGTYHIHYYLDDELVMVTVADITQHCFVSIYFFYDPAIRFIHPGIYTVVREIALTRQLQKSMPLLEYYILGYYNFTIPKISYKQQFRPTEIQCPDTYRWLPIDTVLPRIRTNCYARLSDDQYNPKIDQAVDNLMVSLYSMPAMRYGSLPPNVQLRRELLSKLVQEFGPYGISDDIILNITADLKI